MIVDTEDCWLYAILGDDTHATCFDADRGEVLADKYLSDDLRGEIIRLMDSLPKIDFHHPVVSLEFLDSGDYKYEIYMRYDHDSKRLERLYMPIEVRGHLDNCFPAQRELLEELELRQMMEADEWHRGVEH